jgi:hypothetical protein
VLLAACAVVQGIRRSQRHHDPNGALLGAAILAGMTAFLVTSVFGDKLDNEWGYWIVGIAASYQRLYGVAGVERQDVELSPLEPQQVAAVPVSFSQTNW